MSSRAKASHPSRAALLVAAVVALNLAAAGCGGSDSGDTAPQGQEKVNRKKELGRQDAYSTAFRQCQRIGAEALRTNYGTNGSLGLLAQIYVSQTTYFDAYQQEAIRGCTVGLSR